MICGGRARCPGAGHGVADRRRHARPRERRRADVARPVDRDEDETAGIRRVRAGAHEWEVMSQQAGRVAGDSGLYEYPRCDRAHY